MKALLVRRDPVSLIEQEGTVTAVRELPDFLRQQPLAIHPFYYNWRLSWPDNRILLEKEIKPADVLISSYNALPEKPAGGIPAFWSGYRSCITEDDRTGELFRLKGVAFGMKPSWNAEAQHVEGGSFLRNAHFERIYSDRFNRILREEGIEPVMEYVGVYTFLSRVQRRKTAASIIRVKGDTRLDELLDIIDYFGRIYVGENVTHPFWEAAAAFSTEIGQAVGTLKRLMDKNGQTWSDNPKRTNAHIGNVVVYPTDAGNLAVGLVDFDASCDLHDKTSAQLQAQQQAEYKTIIKSTLWDGTYRLIWKHNFDDRKAVRTVRRAFVSGFITGYETSREGCPEISLSRFLDIREQLQESIHPILLYAEQFLGLKCHLKEYNRRLFHALKRNLNRFERNCQRCIDGQLNYVEQLNSLINGLIKRSIGYSLDELIFDQPPKT